MKTDNITNTIYSVPTNVKATGTPVTFYKKKSLADKVAFALNFAANNINPCDPQWFYKDWKTVPVGYKTFAVYSKKLDGYYTTPFPLPAET